MNILKVQECVQVENQRLVLQNKLAKVSPEDSKHKEMMMEIIRLTAEINNMHRDIEERK